MICAARIVGTCVPLHAPLESKSISYTAPLSSWQSRRPVKCAKPKIYNSFVLLTEVAYTSCYLNIKNHKFRNHEYYNVSGGNRFLCAICVHFVSHLSISLGGRWLGGPKGLPLYCIPTRFGVRATTDIKYFVVMMTNL